MPRLSDAATLRRTVTDTDAEWLASPASPEIARSLAKILHQGPFTGIEVAVAAEPLAASGSCAKNAFEHLMQKKKKEERSVNPLSFINTFVHPRLFTSVRMFPTKGPFMPSIHPPCNPWLLLESVKSNRHSTSFCRLMSWSASGYLRGNRNVQQ